jgi:hypothetical protein
VTRVVWQDAKAGKPPADRPMIQRKGRLMIALGSNVHVFARPHRREELARCFETALGCGPVRTVKWPGIDQPMLIVSFPPAAI